MRREVWEGRRLAGCLLAAGTGAMIMLATAHQMDWQEVFHTIGAVMVVAGGFHLGQWLAEWRGDLEEETWEEEDGLSKGRQSRSA